jgi:hypothetical protein
MEKKPVPFAIQLFQIGKRVAERFRYIARPTATATPTIRPMTMPATMPPPLLPAARVRPDEDERDEFFTSRLAMYHYHFHSINPIIIY